MMKFIKKSHKKLGQSPGTLVHVGEKKVEKTKITIIEYDKTRFEERTLENLEDCPTKKDTELLKWINIIGIHDVKVIERIGTLFDLHPLTLEDILNTDQRPKMENFEHYIYFVMKFFALDSENGDLKSEQVSIILGNNFVISFQECDPDIFEPVKIRLKGGKGRSRKQGSDYLTYALIDLVIDSYFVVLEKIGEHADIIEDDLVGNPDTDKARIIHTWKRNIIFLRKYIWPLRELINNLEKEESTLIKKTTRIYLRDLYDHTIHVVDTIETYRDIFSGMLDIYLSSISNRMNEVMKVLTIIATIFIPVTFIAGIYGMNFKYMPELEWHWSYPVFWILVLSIIVLMVLYFRRKNWL